jgi:hypothetical protein
MQAELTAKNTAYEDFIQGVRLVNLGLKSCSARLDREKWIGVATSEKKEVRILKDQYETSEIGERHFDIVGKFSVNVSESIELDPYLTVECEFQAHFHASTIQKSLVDRFATSDFRFVAIPYARQFVSSITTQMSIPPLIIPLSTRVRREAPTAVSPSKRQRRIRQVASKSVP